MYGSNMDYYGHLVNDENFLKNSIKTEINQFNEDFEVDKLIFKFWDIENEIIICFNISSNKIKDWKRRYLSPDYESFVKDHLDIAKNNSVFILFLVRI